uniref:Uncharacterized protein n=1 Tax=Arundo donax TaxID=35708 RepID=A0A0A9EFD0_ARUDO
MVAADPNPDHASPLASSLLLQSHQEAGKERKGGSSLSALLGSGALQAPGAEIPRLDLPSAGGRRTLLLPLS